ncbi:hypothetical protein LEN26_014818 [Aphanomyces euteiches]|nr:hypothetical protein AeMF1_021316 [Aphanomyces euteiches]KAH9105300.1 hypothetical protein LEN26_014818 [Aphanomyces euteiches]KAH9194300.1 hypothetical protein AeNC1_003718 [Aphanomyces euteiches]
MAKPLLPWQDPNATPYSTVDQLAYFIEKYAASPKPIAALTDAFVCSFPPKAPLGVRFHNTTGRVLIQDVIPNAFNSGLVAESQLTHVNGVDVTLLSMESLISVLKKTLHLPRLCFFQSSTPSALPHNTLTVFGVMNGISHGHSIPLPSLAIVDVACGSNHLLLRSSTGLVFSFGSGDCGRLGHGDTNARALPVLIQALRSEVITSIACGRDHSVCMSESGNCYSFGWGEGGRLGLGVDTGNVLWPTKMDLPPSVRAFHLVAAGRETTVLVSICNRVWMCGLHPLSADKHELLLSPKPFAIPGNGLVVGIKAGDAHCAARTSQGEVFTWGDGASGALGQGDLDTKSEPTLVQGLNRVVKVVCGAWHSACITNQRELWLWGDHAGGKNVLPTRVCSEVEDAACGNDGAVYVKTSNETIWTWPSKDILWNDNVHRVRLSAGGAYATVVPVTPSQQQKYQ